MYFRVSHLHVPLQLLQQVGVPVQPHEGLAEARGEGEDAGAHGSPALHELSQSFTAGASE